MAKKENKKEDQEGRPLCLRCGTALILEESEWMCPHCHGEIHFLGDEDD